MVLQQTIAPDDLPTIEATGGATATFATGAGVADDGVSLRYAHWPPATAASAGTVLYLNGRSEFIEKSLETCVELTARGYAVWTFDWRGQGLSQRWPDRPQRGHIDSYDTYLRDLAGFVDRVVLPARQGPLILVAHSMGGHLALRFLHDRPGLFAAAVLSAPMVDVELGGGPNRLLARLTARLAVWFGVGGRYSPGSSDYRPAKHVFVGNRLTSDRVRFARQHGYIRAEPRLALGGPTLGWVDATLKSIAIVGAPAYAAAITTPALILTAGDERVVSNPALHALCAAMPRCELRNIADARHEILMEQDPARRAFWQAFDVFVAAPARSVPAGSGPPGPVRTG